MRNSSIPPSPTYFLQVVIILVGISALFFLLGEPHFEGRNVDATIFEVYFNDPFLVYVYLSSIPFFVALYHIFTMLRNAERCELPNQRSVKALQTIQYCAMAMVVLIGIGVVWLLSFESDDRPPILAMGLVTTLISMGVAIGAAKCSKKMQHVEMSSQKT